MAILTLALGIGANTAIFGVLNAVLLRNLPVKKPQELVLFGKGEWVGASDTLPDGNWQLFSYSFYREFRASNRVFSNVAAISSVLCTTHGRVASEASLEKINVELVSGSYFHTLGVNPILGRGLTEGDDQTPGAHPVAVASYSWWQRRFAQTPRIPGERVTIGATIYTVIGVAPSGFFGVTVGQSPDLWIPLTMEKEISPGWNGLDNNLFQSLYVIARRKPGVSLEQASANTNLVFKQILRGYVGARPSPKELRSIQHAGIELRPAATGLSPLRREFSSALEILMAVVGLVLLIACANVANLLLARASSRRREMAVRMSMGADRSRLIRQLLVESGLLGITGAVLGALFAWRVSDLLIRMVSPESQPIPIGVALDAQVLGFTMAVAIATVLLFGVAPAFHTTRLELSPALKEGRGVVGGKTRNRLSRGLIVGQVSISLTLLMGAILFLRSLNNLMNVDTGFDKQNVVIIGVDPGASGYRVDGRLESMMERVEERVGSLPGVHGASFAFSIFGDGWTDAVTVPGRPKSESDPDVFHDIVGPEYLKAIKTPIVLGRDLSLRDTSASKKVVVVNETMARTYFPNGSPIGRTFSVGNDPEWQNIEIAGVARDAKYLGLGQKQMPAAFYPHSQHGLFLYTLVARYTGDPRSVSAEIRSAIHSIDPNLPVGDSTTLKRLVQESVLNQRLVAQLSTFFGLLAAFLSCVGIYGVVSYGVALRTNEFGIRMALGAERANVLRMVIREALRLVVMGAALGVVLAVASGRLVESQLFGLKSHDPLAMGVALAAMVAVALFASYLPARRAMRIDPVVALKYE